MYFPKQDLEEHIRWLNNNEGSQQLLFVVGPVNSISDRRMAGFLNPIQNNNFETFIKPVLDFIKEKEKYV